MWLTIAVIFLTGGLVLRRLRDRWTWSSAQRAMLALTPAVMVLAGIAVLLATPYGTQMTESAAAVPFGGPPHVVRATETVTFVDAAGGRGVVILAIPFLLAAMPLAFGIRPWPRRAFSVSAAALTAFSLVAGFSVGLQLFPGASVGLQLFPGAMAAWLPVLGGPRK